MLTFSIYRSNWKYIIQVFIIESSLVHIIVHLHGAKQVIWHGEIENVISVSFKRLIFKILFRHSNPRIYKPTNLFLILRKPRKLNPTKIKYFTVWFQFTYYCQRYGPYNGYKFSFLDLIYILVDFFESWHIASLWVSYRSSLAMVPVDSF